MAETAHLADDGLRRACGGRARRKQVRDRRVHGRVQRLLALDDLVDEPDPGRPRRIEAAAAREQGPRVALADLGDDDRADDGRQDPQARLGEPEAGPALGDDEVRDGAQAGAATQGRAMDPRDDRCRAGIDELERVGHDHGVLFIAFDVELHGGPHPGDVRPGTERRTVAGQDDLPEVGGGFPSEDRERRPQLGDERRIERVMGLGARQRHAGDDPAGTGALEADVGTHPAIVPPEALRSSRCHPPGSRSWAPD